MMLKDSHFMHVALKKMRAEFSTDGKAVEVFIIWGLSGLDKDNVGFFDADDAGKIEFDTEFDLSTEVN